MGLALVFLSFVCCTSVRECPLVRVYKLGRSVAVFRSKGSTSFFLITDDDDDELPQQDGCDPIFFCFFFLIPLCNITVMQKPARTTFLSSK
jgi:hypothetical protein